MSDRPDNPEELPLEPQDDGTEPPPAPEQIWPPPEDLVPQAEEAEPVETDDSESWAEDAEEIDESIEAIRRANGEAAGEARRETEPEPAQSGEADMPAPEPAAETDHWAAPAAASEPYPEEAAAAPTEPPADIVAGTTAPPASTVPRGPSATAVRCRVRERSEGELAHLWNNVFFSAERAAPKTVVVTAVRAGDGATQIAASLALVGTESNEELQIALADFNLRHPSIAEVLGIRQQPGLTDVIDGRYTLQEAMQTIQLANNNVLHVLASGAPPGHPFGMIKSRQAQAVIAQLRESYDHALLDVASADSHPDAQVIGSRVDGVLLVVRGGSTPRETVAEAKKRLDLAGVCCLGLVLNQRTDPVPDLLYRMA